jgi:hypothetical protein
MLAVAPQPARMLILRQWLHLRDENRAKKIPLVLGILIGQHFSQGTDPQVQPINPSRIAAAFDHPSPTRRDTIRRTEANEED